ncbi:MAG: AAA family ATPase, partial [Kiritimatiellia bacterium]
MLKSLQVQNLALVEKAQLDFHDGLNVITGETGAGKSLLVGALNLALGERADRGAVRDGATQCTVEACFTLRENSPVFAMLNEYGLPACLNGELIVRRIVAVNGGRQFINDSAVTLQVLKLFGDLLADMHGPHDHQSLLDPGAQLELLDGFGRLDRLRRDYTAVYTSHEELLRRRRELQQLSDSSRDWLEFQLRELEEAGLDEAEETVLLDEQKLLGNSQRVQELAAEAGAQLMDAETSAFNALAVAHNALEALEQLASLPGTWRTELAAAMTKVRETARELEGLMQRAEADPERLGQVEQRLSVYQKIKRKYGG